MSEFLRKYWFVCLLGIAFFGVLVYFIVDMNKDNVSGRSVDGQQVVASTDLGDVTAEELFDDSQSYSQTLLYNLYRNAVVDQAIEADGDMKKEAKTMSKNIKSNMDADASGKTRMSILSELASYGFTGDNALYDYCLTSTKIRKLDAQFVKDNFEKLKASTPEGARTISIITMQVPNDTVLSDESTKKQEDIQAAIDAGTDFAEIAKQYSDDEATRENGGYYGYIDASSTALNEEVVKAATALEAGGISDWISVQPSADQMFTLYRVYVNETDPSKIIASETEADVEGLVNSMVTTVNGLETAAVVNAAKDLTITFENDDVKEKVESYIETSTSVINGLLGVDDSKEDEAKDDSSKEDIKAASSKADDSSAVSESSTASKEGE